jgi:hypothetical protein
MPLFIKIDFRKDGRLGAWWSHDDPFYWKNESMHTEIGETRIRDVLIALADEIDPADETDPIVEPGNNN